MFSHVGGPSLDLAVCSINIAQLDSHGIKVLGNGVLTLENDLSEVFNTVGFVGGAFGTLGAEGRVASLAEES